MSIDVINGEAMRERLSWLGSQVQAWASARWPTAARSVRYGPPEIEGDVISLHVYINEQRACWIDMTCVLLESLDPDKLHLFRDEVIRRLASRAEAQL